MAVSLLPFLYCPMRYGHFSKPMPSISKIFFIFLFELSLISTASTTPPSKLIPCVNQQISGFSNTHKHIHTCTCTYRNKHTLHCNVFSNILKLRYESQTIKFTFLKVHELVGFSSFRTFNIFTIFV